MKKKTYKRYTVRELIKSLKEVVETTDYITLDSPVLISDFNMSGFKTEFDLIPSFCPNNHTVGLCLFHSLGEVSNTSPVTPQVEEEIIEEEIVGEEFTEVHDACTETHEGNNYNLLSFMKRFKN